MQRLKRLGFDPWVRKILWRRAWQPTVVVLAGESCGQRRLAGCGSQDHTEQDMTEQLSMHTGMLRSLLSIFSSRSFVVSGFVLKFAFHFELIFVYGVRQDPSLLLLHVAVQFSHQQLLKRLFLFPLYILGSLVSVWVSAWALYFVPLMCLFLCEYYTIFIVNTAL